MVRVAEVAAGGVPTQAAVNATGELKLLNDATMIDDVTVEPALKMTVPEDVREKSAAVGDMTYNVKVAECDSGPLAPDMVRGYMPTGTLPATNIVSVEGAVPPAVGVTGFALNPPVIPEAAENESVTGDAKLF